MPVSRRGQQQAPPTDLALRTPQARVLAVLMPIDAADPVSEWPLITRTQLAVRAGYTATSGSITRALNGIRAGSSSGDAHSGLLERGLVEAVTLDIDGIEEVNYRATAIGVRAFQAYIAAGGKLPPVKEASVCTNERYRKSE